MYAMTQLRAQSTRHATIPMTGRYQKRKEPPKIIERMIDKFEQFLTAPTISQQVAQPESSEETNEFLLPKGTTITLPNGKSFETQIESRLSKT